MRRLSWGVDGYGRAHLTEDGVNVVFIGLVGQSGLSLSHYYEGFKMDELLDYKNVNYKPRISVVEAKSFKVLHQGTEYIFDSMEDVQNFKSGFKQAINGGESLCCKKSYLLGYQVGKYGVNKSK